MASSSGAVKPSASFLAMDYIVDAKYRPKSFLAWLTAYALISAHSNIQWQEEKRKNQSSNSTARSCICTEHGI